MAKNVVINEVTYSSVPQVEIPKVGGGVAVFIDASAGDAVAGDIRNGKKAYTVNGEVTGNLATVAAATVNISTKSQVVSVPAGITDGNYKVQLDASAVSGLTAGNIKSGVTVLGVQGALSAAVISQDSSTKVLSIS